MVYYIGAYLDEASQEILMDHILSSAGIHTFKTPANIEVHKRTGEMGKEFFIIINHGSSEQAVELPWPAYEHLAHREVDGAITLPPYGIAVLTKQVINNSEISGTIKTRINLGCLAFGQKIRTFLLGGSLYA